MTVEQFYAANRGAMLSIEAAGAGFAAAVVHAAPYAGQEISSAQALVGAGIRIPDSDEPLAQPAPADVNRKRAAALCRAVHGTLVDQAAGWRGRSFFERQWLLRTFKQKAGLPVEGWIAAVDRLGEELAAERDAEVAIVNGWKADVESLRAELGQGR